MICSVQSTLQISTLAAQLLVTSSCPLLAGVGGEEPQPSYRTYGDQVSTPELQQGRSAVERSSLHPCSSLSRHNTKCQILCNIVYDLCGEMFY